MKKNKKRIIGVVSFFLILIIIAVATCLILEKVESAGPISDDEVQTVVSDTFSGMLTQSATDAMKYIAEISSVKVNSVEKISDKEIKALCDINTINAYDDIVKNINSILTMDTQNPVTGMSYPSSRLKGLVSEKLLGILKGSEKKTFKNVEIHLYDSNGVWTVYTPDEIVNQYYGNAPLIVKYLKDIDTVTDAGGNEVKVDVTLKRGIEECFGGNALRYDSKMPVVGGSVSRWISKVKYDFYRNFIEGANWKYLTKGLGTTLTITAVAALIGIVLGFIIAIIRITYDRTGKLWILNGICKAYLAVIRGTPVMVQLMIIYFVIFMPIGVNKILAAIICFGLNSGAYVAEIVRGGIMGLDVGQNEAGRSLGLTYGQTMRSIIMPQAFKAVLPALLNEMIALLKETSVAAYIGINDLARGGDIIRGVTYSAFMPLLAVALIYLALVLLLTKLVGILEGRLRKSDRG